MSNKKYDIVWHIGRFQIYHKIHRANTQFCIDNGDHVVLMLGSANLAATPANPWSAEERIDMITRSFRADGMISELSGVYFQPINDSYYNWDRFLDKVRESVEEAAQRLYGKPASELRVAMVGPKKDKQTAKYVDLLKGDYDYLEVPIVDGVSASELRAEYFELEKNCLPCGYPQGIDAGVRTFLYEFAQTTEYERLQAEYEYKKGYLDDRRGTARYPINDCAADALVTTASSHVLLMRRTGEIGYGQWALPGGHLNLDETFFECAMRELREEVNLRVPVAVLEGSVDDSEVFDYPFRETHTRMVTRAFHFKLKDKTPPKARPGVDEDGHVEAMEVKWFTRTQLRSMKLFSDHSQIIEYFLGV